MRGILSVAWATVITACHAEGLRRRTHTHILTYTHTYIFTHACILTHIYTRMHAHIYTHTHVHIAHTHAHVWTPHTHARIHARNPTPKHTTCGQHTCTYEQHTLGCMRSQKPVISHFYARMHILVDKIIVCLCCYAYTCKQWDFFISIHGSIDKLGFHFFLIFWFKV